MDAVARIKAISAIRDVLELSLDEARSMVTPNISVLTGTRAQALKFAEQLVERGVDADAVSVHRARLQDEPDNR